MQQENSKSSKKKVVEENESAGIRESRSDNSQEKKGEIHSSSALFVDGEEVVRMQESVLNSAGNEEDAETVAEPKVAEIGAGAAPDKQDEAKQKTEGIATANKSVKRESGEKFKKDSMKVLSNNSLLIVIVVVVTFLISWGLFAVKSENVMSDMERKVTVKTSENTILKGEIDRLKMENLTLKKGVKKILLQTKEELQQLLEE